MCVGNTLYLMETLNIDFGQNPSRFVKIGLNASEQNKIF